MHFDSGATITGLRGMSGVGKTALAYMLAEKAAGALSRWSIDGGAKWHR
jgi:ABC-type dipeptide/oligopeptide/nickel transport system ATPase subunit